MTNRLVNIELEHGAPAVKARITWRRDVMRTETVRAADGRATEVSVPDTVDWVEERVFESQDALRSFLGVYGGS